MSSKSNDTRPFPTYVRFVIGGLGGVGATIVTHPLDLVKTRMQLSGEGSATKEHKSSFHAMKSVIQKEGVLGMYSGLTAGMLRQAVYTSTRMGFYSVFLDLSKGVDGKQPGFLLKSLCGLASGMLGAFSGNPADVALIRMAGDGRLAPSQRRNYKNVVDAMVRIAREEGPLALYRGVVPTMGRAMVVNVAQVVTYSQTKELLLKSGYFNDDIKCHLMCSLVSGIVTVIASMPIDIAKTRLQNMKIVEGRPEYSGVIDVWVKIVKKEGLLSLWKGITPSYCRMGPHTLIFFLIIENLTRLYKVHVLKDESSGGF